MPQRVFRVYIDESGDRGLGANTSPFFAFAAVIVEDKDEAQARQARRILCRSLGKPTETVLHWSANIRTHADRKHAAYVLGTLPVTLSYVIVDKASVKQAPTGLHNHALLYNYAARRLLERVSWFIYDQRGIAHVTFAHVKNFKYVPFQTYIGYLRTDRACSIRWEALPNQPRIDSPDRIEMLQWADVAAGSLMAAVVPDQHGDVEDAYLDRVQERIYRKTPGKIHTYGLHVIQGPYPSTCITGQPWWDSFPNK